MFCSDFGKLCVQLECVKSHSGRLVVRVELGIVRIKLGYGVVRIGVGWYSN
jgi:hypothetical protein